MKLAENTKRLLSAVWGSREGFVFVPYKDAKSKEWHETPGIHVNGSFPKIDVPDRADNYFCPVVFSEPQRKKEYAKATNLLWADLDPVHPDDCRIRPSIAWESSPGRYQALWFLTEEIKPDEAASLSKRIAYADGADKGGWDLTQVLRLPGTKNFKYPSSPEVKILWAKRSAYSPHEIRRLYPPVLNDEELPGEWKDVPKMEVDAAISGLSKGLKLRIQRREVSDRSVEIQKLARDLIKAKVDEAIIAHILQRLPYNKFSGRRDEKRQLLKQIASARAAVKEQLERKKERKAPKEEIEQMVVRGWNDFLSQPTVLQWLVEDSWVDGTVGFISGPSKSYKTWIALDLGLSILSGRPFLDQFVVGKTGPVILVQEEDPMPILQERIRLIGNHKGMLPSAEWFPAEKQLKVHYPDYPLHIINLQGFSLQTDERVDQLRRLISQVNPALVILDPLVVMLGGVDEYRATQVSDLLQTVKFWREEFGCAITVVHHWNKGKGDDNERGGQHMYGSFAFHAWLESALHVAPVIDDTTDRIDTVIIEREFKAAPSGRSLRLKFDIDTINKFAYQPILEGETESGHTLVLLDLVLSHPQGMSTPDLVESTGFNRASIVEIMGRLVRKGKIRREKGGGRGVTTTYFPPKE
jgi:hypothetical protein